VNRQKKFIVFLKDSWMNWTYSFIKDLMNLNLK